LVVAVFAGFGMAFIAARLGNARRAAVLATVLAAVMLVEYRHPPDLWHAPPPSVVPEMGIARGYVIAEFPLAPPERFDLSKDAAYMVERIGTWPLLINGYSGFHPQTYRVTAERVRAFPDDRSIRELARLGVQVLAVHEAWYLGQYPEIVGKLQKRTDVEPAGEYGGLGQRVAVFQVMKPGTP
jgi:hypothetical protein